MYEKAVPVSRHRHSGFSVQTSRGYGFAAKMSSVPIVSAEFAAIAREYPIVFVNSGDGGVTPMALLGTEPDKNRFVAVDGNWRARYVPALLRRYPFIFAATDKPDTLVLCVDEDFVGFNELGLGEPLFRQDGGPSEFLNEAMQFLKTLKGFSDQTKRFGEVLAAAEILKPARIEIAGEKAAAISGAKIVDRRRLKALSPNSLADLARRDYLELIYLHLASLANSGARSPASHEAWLEQAGMLHS